jgi:hypothetical protein
MNASNARAWRNGAVTGSVSSVFWLCLDVFVLRPFWPIVAAQAAVLMGTLVLFFWCRATLRRELSRPDYAAIARMERDIWERTFDHAGAPGWALPGYWD